MAPPDGISPAVWAEVEAALKCEDDSGCAAYYMPLYRAAESAAKAERLEDSMALKALAGACSMMLEPRGTPAPFRPVMQMETGRSALPEDFDADALSLFRTTAGATDNADLRARLNDILWLRERDPAAAREAIRSYLDAAESSHLKFEHDRVKRLIRAAQLALQINASKDERDAVSARLQGSAQRLVAAGKPQRALELLEFMLAEHLLDSGSVLAKFTTMFQSPQKISPLLVRRNILLFKAQLHARARDMALAKQSTVAAAETFVEEAGATDTSLAKSHFVEQAIHTLRGIKHHRSHADVVKRIEELKTQLMDLRDHVLAAMQMHEVEIGSVDISEQIQQSIASVSGREPQEALLVIAGMLSRPRFQSLRESAIKALKDSVLGRLFGARHLGSDGRTVGKRDASADFSQPSEEEIIGQMRQMAAYWRRALLAGRIDPARQAINQQRYIAEGDLLWLFDSNPMVPHGHEQILLRGLLAGIRGDFIIAASLLVPQVEHLLRHRLNAKGVVTTGMDRMGVEDQLSLEKLIDLAEQHGLIDASVRFDLQCLLTERTADNLRNEHAHGLIPAAGYYADATRYLWAFVLRWLCLPWLRPSAGKTEGGPHSGDAA